MPWSNQMGIERLFGRHRTTPNQATWTNERARHLAARAHSQEALQVSSDPPENDEHDQNDDDDAKTSAGAIAPVHAVRPGRKRPDEKQDEDDQKDGAEAHRTAP